MARKGEIPDPIFKEEKDKICDAFFGSSDDFYDSLSIGEFIFEFLSSDRPCPQCHQTSNLIWYQKFCPKVIRFGSSQKVKGQKQL